MALTVIYDRTQSDVDLVKQLSTNIKQTGIIPIAYLSSLKGAYNYTDLNRVESNSKTISDLLIANGYPNVITVKTNWILGDELTLEQLNRIRTNLDVLFDSYIRFSDSIPIIKNQTMDFNQANALEFNLYLFEKYINLMLQSFFYSGEIYSGE